MNSNEEIIILKIYFSVDMDCDGQKKNLLVDRDGSFLGLSGMSVISQSEYQWGNNSIGLGDFRIPMTALADVNGRMIPPNQTYTYPGIVRDQALCEYVDSWQAHLCKQLDYRMLMVESMDKDTETRRLSPVAVFADNQYLDLINGPAGKF